MLTSSVILRIAFANFMFGNLSEFELYEHSHYKNLALATLYVVDHGFSKHTPNIIVERHITNKLNLNKNYDTLRLFLLNVKSVAVQLHIESYRDRKPGNFYVFFVDSFGAFNFLQSKFKPTKYEREFYILIVLTSDKHKGYLTTLKMIFDLCWRLKLVDVTVLVDGRNHSVLVYTYFPFNRFKCEDTKPVLFNRFEKHIPTSKRFFPPKLDNLFGCPVRVSASINPPYLMDSNLIMKRHKLHYYRISGIDAFYLNLMSEYLNFKVILSSEIYKYANIYSNLTATGGYYEVQNNIADVAIGGLSLVNPNINIFSTSITYCQSAVIFVIAAGVKFGPIQLLGNPFSNILWIIIGCVLLLSCMIIKLLVASPKSIRNFVLGENTTRPYTNLIRSTLGYPIERVPGRNFARFFFMLWMLTMLILRNAYQSALFDSIRVNRKARMPQNIEELKKMNYSLLCNADTYLFVEKDLSLMNYTLTMDLPYIERFHKLLNHPEKRYSMIGTVDQLSYSTEYCLTMNKTLSAPSFVAERFITQQLVFVFPKNSILRTAFDNKIRQFAAMGMSKIAEQSNVVRKLWLSPLQWQDEPPVITNERLTGIYHIYLSSMATATFIFILEIISQKIPALNRFFNWCIS